MLLIINIVHKNAAYYMITSRIGQKLVFVAHVYHKQSYSLFFDFGEDIHCFSVTCNFVSISDFNDSAIFFVNVLNHFLYIFKKFFL